MEKLNITMEKLDGNELILRTGSALPLEVPKKIKIAGDIKTVSEFINNRIADGKYLANNINLTKSHIRIRLEILDRAKNSCEFCGAVDHHPHPITGSKVILTIAHLDHIPENCSPDNLKALCQKCHLSYDKKHHAINARITRDKKTGTLRLFEEQ